MVGYAEAAWYEPPDELAFTADECDEILAAGGEWIAGRERGGGGVFTMPRSDVAVLADDAVRQRVCDHLAARAAAAVVERGWPGIALDGGYALELLRYRDGAGLGWHRDWLPGHPVFGRCTMAIGVQLSDPDAYAGGALEIETAGGVNVVIHSLDTRGRPQRRLTAEELAEHERQEQRERHEAHLRSLRTELEGWPRRRWDADQRNLANAWRVGQPGYAPEQPGSAEEIEAEIARVQALLDAI